MMPYRWAARLLTASLLLVTGGEQAIGGRPAEQTREAAHMVAGDDQLLTLVADRTTRLPLEAWDWDSGVALYGLTAAARATGRTEYLDFVLQWFESHLAGGLPVIEHPNHLAPGIALLEAYEATHNERLLERARELGDAALRDLPRGQDGAFLHWQSQLWVDTTFMTLPFLSRLGRISGEERYVEEGLRQFRLHVERLQDARTGLFFHGWDADSNDHMSGAFWQRGNGWAAAAGVELLSQLSPDHPARPEVVAVLRRQLGAALGWQDLTGRWCTVIDQPDFYLETSGTAALGYALYRGLADGWLQPARFGRAAERARSGVRDRVDSDGGVLEVSSGTGVAPSLESYNSIPVDAIQPWGQGLTMLLLATRAQGYQIVAAPSEVLLATGGSATVRLRVDAYGQAPAVTHDVEGMPATLDWQVRPVAGDDLAYELTVDAHAQAQPGRYPVLIVARADDLAASSMITLLVGDVHFNYLPALAAGIDLWNGAIPLVDHAAADGQPNLGPGGELAFLSDRTGRWRVYLQAPGDLALAVRVPDGARADRPWFALDGRLAFGVLGRNGNWDPAVLAGGRLTYPLGRTTANELHPSISPDGRWLAMSSDAARGWDIRVESLVGGHAFGMDVGVDRVPSWRPDGRELVFRAERDANSDIFVVDVTDGRLRRLTHDPGFDGWPSFSPDGRWILYQSTPAGALPSPSGRGAGGEGSAQVWLMNAEGGQRQPLTRGRSENTTPAWSPDGRRFVYASTRAGSPDIFMAPLVPPEAELVFPAHDLADKAWRAIERFEAAFPLARVYPAYGGRSEPTAADAEANVQAACYDFPDLPDELGTGAQHRTCYEYVASYLGIYHALRTRRLGLAADRAWAQRYLDVALDVTSEFVYGPEAMLGASHRDSPLAVWQNPIRAVNLVLLSDLLRRDVSQSVGATHASPFSGERRDRVDELLSGISRSWYAHFWETGVHPSSGITLTTLTADDIQAYSLAGRPVVSRVPLIAHWDADAGNTPAEETAWMGAGVMLASLAAGARLLDAQRLYAAAQHYLDYSVALDRPDEVHGGRVNTLNRRTDGGVHGKRRYWIENHAAHVPSIAYAGAVWHFLGLGLMASPLGGQTPWSSLVPSENQYELLLRSALETLRAPDGTLLVDFDSGDGIGYRLDDFPGWWSPCGQLMAGRPYARYDGRAGGQPMFVSEDGSPAGFAVLGMWPLLRLAQHKGDQLYYGVWRDWLSRALDELIARPLDPGRHVCKVAPYLSDNQAFYWARTVARLAVVSLGLSGYEVNAWDGSALSVGRPPSDGASRRSALRRPVSRTDIVAQ